MPRKKDGKFFNGHISDNTFKIAQATRQVNLFTPVILGETADDGSKRVIKIRARMSAAAFVFMCVILLLFGAFTIEYAVNAIWGNDYSPLVFVFGGFGVYAYGVLMLAYKLPWRSCKKKFLELEE